MRAGRIVGEKENKDQQGEEREEESRVAGEKHSEEWRAGEASTRATTQEGREGDDATDTAD